MDLRWIGPGFALAVLCSPAWPQSPAPAVELKQPLRHTGAVVELYLREADAATLAGALGESLGAHVRVEGAAPAPVTLSLPGVPARAALDAVAAALRGDWHPVYSITPGAAPAGVARPLPLGRRVTASLEKVSARAALALVARAGGGKLNTAGELPQSVTLEAKEQPVEEALDDLARQLDATWSVTYVIRPGTAPAPAIAAPARTPPRERVSPRPAYGQLPPARGGQGRGLAGRLQADGISPSVPFNQGRSFPVPPATPPSAAPRGPAADPDAAKLLAEGLMRVMQMPPAQRRNAIKDLAAQLDQQFRQMQALPGPQRAEQMATMRPLFQAATRTYSGLTPDQRGEFQPIMDVFKRWMR